MKCIKVDVVHVKIRRNTLLGLRQQFQYMQTLTDK